MPYLYLKTDAAQPIDTIFKPFEASFLARGGPETMALFHTRGDGVHGYLIPASTLREAPEVGGLGDWAEVDSISNLSWGLLIGHADAWETHNVPKP